MCVCVCGLVGGFGGLEGLRGGSRYGRSIPICIVRRSDLQGGFQKEPIGTVGGGRGGGGWCRAYKEALETARRLLEHLSSSEESRRPTREQRRRGTT